MDRFYNFKKKKCCNKIKPIVLFSDSHLKANFKQLEFIADLSFDSINM